MADLDASFAAALAERQQQSRYRRRDQQQAPAGRCARIDGRELLNFSSNDYLGLANHPEVIAALQTAAAEMGVGSGASHLVCGHSLHHQRLEEALADAVGKPRALLFSTGYMANLALLSTLTDRHDAIFQDRLNHASLLDGGQLSRATVQRYAHAQVDALAARLATSEARRKLVVTDGVFSMDGDVAPVEALLACCRAQDAWLMVDDAHGVGVLGDRGAGSCAGQPVDILMGTLGKALGCFGAFVAGSETLIETLTQFARPYIYTTALPPALAAATLVSLRLMQTETWRRQQLAELIEQWRAGAQALGLTLLPSNTPIQPLLVGSDEAALKASTALRERGLLVVAIRPPTVPEGSARLRITLTAAHTSADVAQLLAALAQLQTEGILNA